MKKKGLTLIEVLVYMAIAGIEVIIAGQAFGDSTKVRVRTQNMLKATKIAENVGIVFRDDLAQMGAKSSENINDTMVLSNDVYMDAGQKDYSSFTSFCDRAGTNLDSIVFRRLAYDSVSSLRVEEIGWYVRGNKLYRSCKTISGTVDASLCPQKKAAEVEIADDVMEFVLTPAQPGVAGGNDTLFPVGTSKNFRLVSLTGNDSVVPLSVLPETGGAVLSLTGFATNYNENEFEKSNYYHQLFVKESGGTDMGWKTCKKFNFKKDSTYEISFTMPYNDDASRMFQPGKDHFSMGIRRIEGNHMVSIADVPDFFFFPPMAKDGIGERRMRFSTHLGDLKDVCIAFTFANYSPAVGAGTIGIGNILVEKIAESNYRFSDGFRRSDFTLPASFADKANVRAFQMRLKIKKGGEEGKTIITVPVPSNGTKEYVGAI